MVTVSRSRAGQKPLALSGAGTQAKFDLTPSPRRVNSVSMATEAITNCVEASDNAILVPTAPIRTADQWVRAHSRELNRHRGQWLAISANGIVAVGQGLADVRRESIQKGHARDDVIVFKIPREPLKTAVPKRRA